MRRGFASRRELSGLGTVRDVGRGEIAGAILSTDQGLGGLVPRSPADEPPRAPLNFPARQQDPAATGVALEPDVSAQPDDGPLVAAARVGLSQTKHIARKERDRCVPVRFHRLDVLGKG
jgi:hypothetical protein